MADIRKGGLRNVQDPKDMEEIFKAFQARDLVDPSIETLDDFLDDVIHIMNKNEWSISQALTAMEAKRKLPKASTKEIQRFVNSRSLTAGSANPFKYEGFPLLKTRYKGGKVFLDEAPKEVLNDPHLGKRIYTTGGKNPREYRKYKVKNLEVFGRGIQQEVPFEVAEWFEELEDAGKIPEGTLAKYEDYIRTGRTLTEKLANDIQKATGIKMDRGHLHALLRKGGMGGTDDPIQVIKELASENRAHGNVDTQIFHQKNLTQEASERLSRDLDLPSNWWESATDYVLRQEGIAGDIGIPIPEELRHRIGSGYSDKQVMEVMRFGKDPMEIQAETVKRIEDYLNTQAMEAAPQAAKPRPRVLPKQEIVDILPKGARQVRIQNQLNQFSGKPVFNPDGTVALAGSRVIDSADEAGFVARQLGSVEHASVLARKQNVANLKAFTKPGTTIGRRLATVMPFIGAGADVWDLTERIKQARANPDDQWDQIQAAISGVSVGTTWYAEPVNFGAGVLNLGIDVGRTILEEDKRKAAGNTLRALGTHSLHGIRDLTKTLW